MDMERITLTYADIESLVRDLRGSGRVNVARRAPPRAARTRTLGRDRRGL